MATPVSPLRRVRLLSPSQLTTAGLALGGTAVVALADPNTTHVPLCPLHAMTGLWCPFCGGLRAVYALTRGRVSSALHDNVLVVTLLPIAVLLWLDGVRRSHRERPARRLPLALRVALIVAVVAFGVVRNLAPFAALRP